MKGNMFIHSKEVAEVQPDDVELRKTKFFYSQYSRSKFK